MTENKDVREANLLRLNTNKTKGNPGSFYSELDDFPPSLISYFEISKSRAAACEKLILGELEDHKTETEKDFPLNVGDRRPEREKPHHEQLQKTEQRQQRETDFQEELRRITEAEKFQQMELELRKRTAQEKLEQELQLQQELLCNFKKQVEKERMMIEEEERRKSEEEAKVREKEERRKKEEENQRKRREENQRGIEVRLQKESERRVAEEMRKQEGAEKRKRKQEKNTEEDGIRREKEEVRRLAAQGQWKKKEEETKMEEKRCFMITGKKVMEDEVRKRDQVTLKDELNTMQEKDDEEKKLEEDLRFSSLCEVRVNQEEMRKEEEDEEREDRKTLEKEMQHRESEDRRKIDNWKSLCFESERRIRKKEETGRGKEIGQRVEIVTQRGGEERRNTKQETKVQQEMKGSKGYERENREGEDLEKTEDEEKIQEELKDPVEKDDHQMKDNGTKGEEVDRAEKDEQVDTAEDTGDVDAKTDLQPINGNNLEENKGGNDVSESQNSGRTGQRASLMPHPTPSEATAKRSICETPPLRHPDDNISDTSTLQTVGQIHPESQPSASSCSLPASLPECTELKRLSWMEHCVSWSELSLQNKRKERGSFQSQRRTRRAGGLSALVPLCPRTLLESTGTKSLQEVTTVVLEDLAPCSLSTLSQCDRLQSLTLCRCGLRSLEGISQLQELCYMDLGENEISFLDCEHMGSLRVLRLAHNKLTSIHGLNGAHSLDVLDLSHNSITRIAGLESMRRLQKLLVAHNQLISTKGLKDVYTLHHLDCSHNHLANVEGLENSALLHTLDLRSNSLTEPPSLNNQVLLRELLLDDNSISSLHGLAGCWLPLLLRLSVAQNRITQLPSMTDFVSLKHLDLRFNCLSELQDVCGNLERCVFLQEVHLTGNPLQQETDWKFKLQKAVAGLKAADGQQTHSSLSLATDSFLMLCQVQLQQTQDLQQRLSRELRNASSSLDAMKSCCHHFTQALQLAEDQRFAHEYGDITLSAVQARPEKPPDMDGRSLGKLTDSLKTESATIRPPDSRNQPGRSEDTPDEKNPQDTFGSVTTGQRSTTESNVARGFVDFLPSYGERTSTSLDMEPDDLDSKNAAATVLQRMQRTSGEKRGHAEASDIRGDADKPLFEISVNNMNATGENHAATVIQAFWKGCALRRRLASALAAFTCPEAGEDDTFEELDVEEFVVDESALEEHWTMTFSEDSSSMRHPVTEQHLPPQVVFQPMQAWVTEEKEEEVEEEEDSVWSSTRSKTPVSTWIQSGLSERSEKILQEWGFTNSRTAFLMLKRAQKMKATKKQQKKHRNPFVSVAFSGCNYQINSAEARSRTSRCGRQTLGVGEAQLGLRWAEQPEQTRRQQAEQQLKTQVALRERRSERGQFLPEIKSSILSRGTVQAAACGAQPNATRLCSNSSLIAPLGIVNRSNVTCAGKDALPPRRVASPVVKKERISFRDNPVQLSGGWGGGRKRDRLPKN
ncbi:leucine-rich repeat and IQ domain-containing protein 1 isoform X1 [Xiphophorus couchianus]|uniref:leucine-rich repeat and IQ domain-containing protein 1 isoform X1 n=2 Tax=Xiphophorus couchianus TaxID=32473 RepID=UPI00101683FB|nr:leucine-rich repeat and IQ domain-containing protein 1 isoform X1 [Xiphophorus couchianus]